MTSLTRISPITKHKTISYADDLVSYFWEKSSNTTSASIPNQNQATLLSELAECTNSVICIQTSELGNNIPFIKALYNAALQKKNRIYLLLKQKEACVRTLAGHCLVRYGYAEDADNGTFILVNPKTSSQKGFFLNAPLADITNSFMLDLDTKQIEELLELYCYNFWHQAQFEFLTEEDFESSKTCPKSLSYPSTSPSAKKKWEILSTKKFQYFHCPNWKDSFWATQLVANSALITEQTLAADTLKTLIDNGNTLRSVQNPNLHFVLTECLSEGVLFSNNPNSSFFLELNPQQCTQLKTEFDILQKQAEFFFVKEKELANLLHHTIQTTDQPPKQILVREKNAPKLADVQLTQWWDKPDFDKKEPIFPVSTQEYLSVEYSWDTIPFYLPKGAKKHTLYNQWETCRQAYDNFWKDVDNFFGNNQKQLEFLQSYTYEPDLKREFLSATNSLKTSKAAR